MGDGKADGGGDRWVCTVRYCSSSALAVDGGLYLQQGKKWELVTFLIATTKQDENL